MSHLVSFLSDLQAVKCDLYLHQQHIDTTTPSGRALFQMCGVFAEFERSMIVERVNAGMARAKAGGLEFGRGKRKDGTRNVDEQRWKMSRPELVNRIHELRNQGYGMLKISKELCVGTSIVQKVLKPDHGRLMGREAPQAVREQRSSVQR
jgi:DNA invertase Pin-like site-specific DNA recombinase